MVLVGNPAGIFGGAVKETSLTRDAGLLCGPLLSVLIGVHVIGRDRAAPAEQVAAAMSGVLAGDGGPRHDRVGLTIRE